MIKSQVRFKGCNGWLSLDEKCTVLAQDIMFLLEIIPQWFKYRFLSFITSTCLPFCLSSKIVKYCGYRTPSEERSSVERLVRQHGVLQCVARLPTFNQRQPGWSNNDSTMSFSNWVVILVHRYSHPLYQTFAQTITQQSWISHKSLYTREDALARRA